MRFDILEEIEQKLPSFPLVLHGASSVPHSDLEVLNKYGGEMEEAIGIPETMLSEASKHAVCKINVGTDIRVAYVGGLRKALAENKDKFDVRVFVNPAMESVRNLIRNKLDNVFHSSGHAND